MIMPALTGQHVPQLRRRGRLHAPALHRDGAHRGRLAARRASTSAPLPLDEVAEIGAKVATALHDLHRQHVVHLDVKPSNIMFRAPTAARRRGADRLRPVAPRRSCPTCSKRNSSCRWAPAPYMSPEQVQLRPQRSAQRPVRARRDALPPHDRRAPVRRADDACAACAGACSATRCRRARLRADCPPWLQEVILKCLEVQPDNAATRPPRSSRFDLQQPGPGGARRDALDAHGALAASGRDSSAGSASLGAEPQAPRRRRTEVQSTRSPIVMAAVDVGSAEPALLDQLRETRAPHRLLGPSPARVSPASDGDDASTRIGTDALTRRTTATSRHVKQLVSLKHWARPISKSLSATWRGRPAGHVPRARGAPIRRRDGRLRAPQPGRPHRDGRARQRPAAALPGQRLGAQVVGRIRTAPSRSCARSRAKAERLRSRTVRSAPRARRRGRAGHASTVAIATPAQATAMPSHIVGVGGSPKTRPFDERRDRRREVEQARHAGRLAVAHQQVQDR